MSPIRRVRPTRASLYIAGYRRERRRRLVGWALVGIGAVMAVVHGITHLGRLTLIGYQDLLLGYPMASVLVLGGFILVGWTAKPTR